MPELRKDPITARWVIISTDARQAPERFFARKRCGDRAARTARFALGRKTRRRRRFWRMGEMAAGANTSGWSIRVVPNRFPALGIEGELDREGEGLFDKMNGIGAHEVIVETPQHEFRWRDCRSERSKTCCGRIATACWI